MKTALTIWDSTKSLNLKQQWKNMNIYSIKKLIQVLMTSKLKHLSPPIRNFLLWIQTTLLLLLTNPQLISINGHFLSHQIFTHMLQSSPNSYHPWTYQAIPFFKFKNGGMSFILPSSNIFQQSRYDHHTRNSKWKIKTSLNFSSNQALILNIPQQRKTLKHSQEKS